MQYNQITHADILELKKILSSERVFVGEQILEDYAHDELAEIKVFPDVVVEPETTEEVSMLMKFASARQIPVTPRGSGTGLCGAAVPKEGGMLLLTTRMNQIFEIDEENLMAVVQPGVILLDFIETVGKLDLMYPPDPGEKSATLGGNVMTNAGGMRAVQYGVTRDYVAGMEVVLPDGQVIQLGGKVVKNSSGYSLKDLIIGSEGTLGIVTKLTLRLVPLPKKQITLLVPFASLDEAIETVPKIINAKLIPTAIEFMERDVINAATEYLGKIFPDSSAPAYLLLAFYGNTNAELEEVYEQAAEVCLANKAFDVLIADTNERQEVIWETRGTFLEALKAMSHLEECDVVVPRNRIADFVKFTDSLEAKYKIRIRSFGHAGDGNLHIYILKDGLSEEIWQRKRLEVMDEMYRKAKELKGQVSGEHGIGTAKRLYLHDSLGCTQMTLMRKIKESFDPLQILNPGKII